MLQILINSYQSPSNRGHDGFGTVLHAEGKWVLVPESVKP